MKKLRIIFFLFAGLIFFPSLNGQVLLTTKGKVYFKSEAPLEIIEALSGELRGVIKPEDHSFAFSIFIKSFDGFNNRLQKEHFNENYLESGAFPKATYIGKIIEKIDFFSSGRYVVRTKGILTIHGVAQERIIKSILIVEENQVLVKSNFTILLEEHDINVPTIVNQKIAKEIQVEIEATFEYEEK